MPGEGVSLMIDVQRFTREIVAEVKEKYPEHFSENGELVSQLISTMAFVAAIAIEKYEREQDH